MDLEAKLVAIGLQPSREQIAQLEWVADELLRWNENVNLTAIREREEVVDKHLVDSATALLAGVWRRGSRVADVGSGAGFPALPVKILRPDLEVYAIDSVGKKLRFVEHVAKSLGLAGLQAVHARAEVLGQERRWREQFAVVVARAVASLPVLGEWCLPLTAVGGWWVALKGPEGEAEVPEGTKAAALLGGSPPCTKKLTLPGTEYQRTLVAVQKVAATPKAYPRPGNRARKQPLV